MRQKPSVGRAFSPGFFLIRVLKTVQNGVEANIRFIIRRTKRGKSFKIIKKSWPQRPTPKNASHSFLATYNAALQRCKFDTPLLAAGYLIDF
jgi:hypothetical protein